MGLTYRKDEHLEFLSTLDNDELGVLVEILIKSSTNGLIKEEKYKSNYPNHKKYWDLIAADYQRFGGNTFANIFRGSGVLYKEILKNVCDKMKVNYPKTASVDEMEQNLIQKVIGEMIEKMSLEEKKHFLEELGLKPKDFSKAAIMMAIQLAIKQGGVFGYQLAAIVANLFAKTLIGKGLVFVAANQALIKYFMIFGPIGPIWWGWFLIDIAGPAYRVTIPATIYIASLRQSKLKENIFDDSVCPNCKKNIPVDANFCPYCGESI